MDTMRPFPHWRRLLGAAMLAACAPSAWSVPLPGDLFESVFRDSRAGVGQFPGDFIQVDVGIDDADVPAGTTASLRVLDTGDVIPMFTCAGTVASGNEGCAFYSFVPYSLAAANSAYEVTYQNDSDSHVQIVNPYGSGLGDGALPQVENLVVVGGGLTPTLIWELPQALVDHLDDNDCPNLGNSELNDCNVNRLRVRIRDANFVELYDTRSNDGLSLALTATSFVLPDGALNGPGEYIASVFIEGTGSPTTPFFTRSRLRVGFTVPEPPIEAFLALGLLGVALRRSTSSTS